MASFSTSNVSNNLVGRELSTIAFGFVKQYYTLLNKAPCFIYNFYSHDSTFIHGNIEMANEHHAEPIVGRENIKSKMEELKLNDCRAKITQIDCLETLAGGLVIQVIGELSDNGKPMRRFLQTFVLAPSPDESARQDRDSQYTTKTTSGNVSDRRGAAISNNDNNNSNSSNNNNSSNSNRPSHNHKFFVLNSIFRYQDDGHISEFEDDSAAGVNANTSTDSTASGVNEVFRVEPGKQQQPPHSGSGVQIGNYNGAPNSNPDHSPKDHLRRPQATRDAVKNIDEVERLAHELDNGVKLSNNNIIGNSNNNNKPTAEIGEQKRDGSLVVPNGTGNADKKNETSEKSTENGKIGSDPIVSSGPGSTVNNQQQIPVAPLARPQPSNEPKTWANMVRNAHPHTASLQVNANIQPTLTATPAANSATAIPTSAAVTLTERHQQPQQQQQQKQHHQQQQQQQHQSTNQQSSVHQLQQSHQSQQQQQQQQQLPPQQQQQQQQGSPNLNNNGNNNINNNNRRRGHVMRKPSNKSTGRSIKTRPRPPAGKPPAAQA